ncbi:hypothetical protein N0V85_001729 [Neurospora sp. IMI 360204]|nr:hypothetical protein N0V85_001729 [Neurospora sp. IMI 360204]
MIPRPQFFVVRPDTEVLRNDTGAIQREQGPMVPLVAVDELPDWIDIGLPRELTVEQTIGLYNLGMVPHNGDAYRVRIIEPNSQEEFVWKRDSSKATLVSSGACTPGQRTTAHPEQSQRVPYNGTAAPTGRNPNSIHPSSSAEPSSHTAHPSMAAASPNPTRLTRAEDEAMHTMRWADLVERSIARDTEAQDPRCHSTLLAPPPSPQIAPHSHPTVIRDGMSAIGTTSTADQRESVPHNTMATPPKPAANTDAATTTSNTTTVAANPAGVSPGSNTTSANTASSAPVPQEYCRHWCQHGTCKWGTFCRHKHAMPTTLEGLLEVGLCEIPAWWIAATGIGMGTSNGKTKIAAAATGGGTSPTTGAGGNGGGGGSGAPPPPVPCTPMAHNVHHILPTLGGVPTTAKKLSNRKLKAQQREFSQRLRLLTSMLIPPGYGSPNYPLRHPADALLMHGMHGYGSGGPGQQQLQQQMQQQQQQRLERKGEKTPLDRNRKNVKVTFNEDGTVSLVTADDGGKNGGVVAAVQGQSGGETAGTASSAPAGAGAGAAASATAGRPAAGDNGVTDETDKRKENEGPKDMKPVKGLAASMHAPKQDRGQVVVTIPGSMKVTCEDESEAGSVVQLADVPRLVEI